MSCCQMLSSFLSRPLINVVTKKNKRIIIVQKYCNCYCYNKLFFLVFFFELVSSEKSTEFLLLYLKWADLIDLLIVRKWHENGKILLLFVKLCEWTLIFVVKVKFYQLLSYQNHWETHKFIALWVFISIL